MKEALERNKEMNTRLEIRIAQVSTGCKAKNEKTHLS
jgi:hypothetical protein